jgi:succinate-acetate transporter protein
MYLWTPAFLKPFNLLSVIFLIFDAVVPFIVLIDLKIIGPEFGVVPAYGLLAAGIIAIYLAAATVVNTVFGKKIYPVL